MKQFFAILSLSLLGKGIMNVYRNFVIFCIHHADSGPEPPLNKICQSGNVKLMITNECCEGNRNVKLVPLVPFNSKPTV